MSVQGQINRITSARENLKTTIAAKGVSVPASAKLADIPNYISQIQTGLTVYEGTHYTDSQGYRHTVIDITENHDWDPSGYGLISIYFPDSVISAIGANGYFTIYGVHTVYGSIMSFTGQLASNITTQNTRFGGQGFYGPMQRENSDGGYWNGSIALTDGQLRRNTMTVGGVNQSQFNFTLSHYGDYCYIDHYQEAPRYSNWRFYLVCVPIVQ